MIDSVLVAHVSDSITRINQANGVTDTDYDAAAEHAATLLSLSPMLVKLAEAYAAGNVTNRKLDWATWLINVTTTF